MSLMTSLPPVENRERNLVAETGDFNAIERYLRGTGQNILDLLAREFTPGLHYPDGEVWDSVTNAQFFYHVHPEEPGAVPRADGEHGHFHIFLGAGGMPAGVSPLVLPEMAVASLSAKDTAKCVATHRTRRDRGVFAHLIAISLDRSGRPMQLFTTNRWVTGETWYRAEDVARMLPHFTMSPDDSDIALIGNWLGGLLRILRPTIVELLQQRDARMMDWRRRRARASHVFDDRRLEIISAKMINPAAMGRI